MGAKTFNSSPTSPAQATITAANLFPFLDGYGVFAGACSSNNPALAPTSNSALLQTFSPTPGQVLTMTTANDIRMPSINVRVVKRERPRERHAVATVIVKTNDGGCTNTFANQTAKTSTTGTCPSPASPTAPTRSARRHGEAGVTARARRRLQRRYDRAHDANGTSTVVAETVSNKSTTPSATPPRPATRRTPRTNGAIRIKLNRTGCARDAPAPSPDESGFSLVELLVAMVIGMMVLMAAFMVLDRTITASGQVADRSEALQRGRQAMELVTRQLRSQVCVGSTKPIVSGTDTSVSFYADLSDGTTPIKQRTLSYSAVTDTITETLVPGAGTYPNLTFTGTPIQHAAAHQGQADPGQRPPGTLRPIFRYYGYQTGTTDGTLVQLTAPLSATDLGRVAVIKVGFRAFPVRTISNDKDSAVLEDDVYTRVAVPTELQGAPECI